MSTLYFLRQPFTNDPKDTWRIASGRAFDLMPEADRMAVVSAADLAAAQQEIARLRAALVSAKHDLTYAIFNLTDGKKVEDLDPRVVESTCPTKSGLIGLRTIQEALAKP